MSTHEPVVITIGYETEPYVNLLAPFCVPGDGARLSRYGAGPRALGSALNLVSRCGILGHVAGAWWDVVGVTGV